MMRLSEVGGQVLWLQDEKHFVKQRWRKVLRPFLRMSLIWYDVVFFFFQAEDGIRDGTVTGVQTCALPILRICRRRGHGAVLRFGVRSDVLGAPAGAPSTGITRTGALRGCSAAKLAAPAGSPPGCRRGSRCRQTRRAFRRAPRTRRRTARGPSL